MGMQYIELESRRFPDGEGYVRVPTEAIDAVRSEPVVLVSNTYPDSGIVSTLLLLEAIADVAGVTFPTSRARSRRAWTTSAMGCS